MLAAAAKTDKPVVVLASIPAAIDTDAATRLRAAGVPVLESTRTGLLALGHLLSHAARSSSDESGTAAPSATPDLLVPSASPGALTVLAPDPLALGHLLDPVASLPPVARASEAPSASGRNPLLDPLQDSTTSRRLRWSAALSAGPVSGADLFDLLRDYGIPAVSVRSAATLTAAVEGAAAIGYPVAIKTDEPGIAHKSDVGGVRLNVGDPAALAAAYEDLAARLGPRVTVCAMAAPGTELILGMARDPALGPLIVVGAGGVLAEYLSERSIALPPVTRGAAVAMISALRLAGVLAGLRGAPAADMDAVTSAIVSFSVLASDLGEHLEAFDINPLICSPSGVIAVDALTTAS